MAYSQTSRDRLAANVFIALPVLVLLGAIRYLQRPRVQDDSPPTALTP
jgi:hypothetical protein